MSEILFLLFIAAFCGGGWLLLRRYERYLDAQMGPWVTVETQNRVTGDRTARRRR